jgi:hypothetical protein
MLFKVYPGAGLRCKAEMILEIGYDIFFGLRKRDLADHQKVDVSSFSSFLEAMESSRSNFPAFG